MRRESASTIPKTSGFGNSPKAVRDIEVGHCRLCTMSRSLNLFQNQGREDPGDIYRAISFRYRLESTFSWRWWTTAPNFRLERSPGFNMYSLDAGLVHRQARTAGRYFASLTPEAISNEIGVTTPPPSLPLLQALRHLQTANRLSTRWYLVRGTSIGGLPQDVSSMLIQFPLSRPPQSKSRVPRLLYIAALQEILAWFPFSASVKSRC